MKLHPRFLIVKKAASEFADAVGLVLNNLDFLDVYQLLCSAMRLQWDPELVANTDNAAEEGFLRRVLDIKKAYVLTQGEFVGMIAQEIANLAKYNVRQERHAGTDKKGDEE